MFQPCSLAILAKCALPFRPCSSPATVRKIMVAGNLSWLRTRAHSRLTAVPLASSLAPGAIRGIKSVAVARIVVAGDQHDALRTFRIGALQYRINIGDYGRFRNPVGGILGEGVGLDLEAAAAVARVAFEFRLNPFARRADAVARLDGIRDPEPKA